MIYVKADVHKYKEDFIKKFTSFADKSPIMLSFVTDDLGVKVIHENSGISYFYEWVPEIPIKSFIHHIKQDLSKNHYPRICRKVEITRSPTEDEIADKIAKNEWAVDNVPVTITYQEVETYRIDKIIAMKDEFVIVNEKTNEAFCYRMEGTSGIYFLKNYREGKYKDFFEAGNDFFKKSILLKKLDK